MRRKTGNTLMRLCSILLCLLLALSLGGCRYSDVLEEIIYDQLRAREMDYDPPFHPEDNDIENEEESEDLKELDYEDEAERTEDEVPSEARTTAGTQANSQTAPQVTYEATAPTSNNAAPAASTPTRVTSVGEGNGAETVQGNNGAEAGGTGEQGQSYSPTPSGATKQVTDAFGETVEIPENVQTVATVGQTALITLMLGGVGRLAATDYNTVNNAGERAAFPGLESVEALWSGSGKSGMAEDAFQRLLEVKPDVVVEISWEGTVSDAQAQQLAAAGIAYLVLPQMTRPDAVKTAVTTMGQVLGDTSATGGTDAPGIAKAYNEWLDSAVSRVSDATKQYAGATDAEGKTTRETTYTLYIDGWDHDAAYRLYNSTYTTRSGTGCAYVNNSGTESCQALDGFLSCANIKDTAALYGISPKTQYMTPLISDYRTMEVTGNLASGVYPNGQMLLEYNHISLGTDYFPAVIVPDQAAKAALEADQLWGVFPHINTGNGDFNSDGFLDEDGHIVRTQISGAYEVKVNPRGLLSRWTEGGPEGILEALWAANSFFGAISDEELQGYIADLYSRFYGYNLSADEIQTMLAGGNG